MANILIVEDEPVIRESLMRLLQRNHFSVTAVSGVVEAEKAGLMDFDLIIADIRLPGEPGTELIARAAPVPVMVMTSYSSVQSAVDAMKQGAVDYISKPFNHEDMILQVKKNLQHQDLKQENAVLKRELRQHYPLKGLIGNSACMEQVYDRIERVAGTDTPVLILGETGTGKELAARAIHERSLRAEYPIVSLNCATIPENLMESELFGHQKGAFTSASQHHKGLFEAADSGTLFLDEIGELSLEAQAKLLRVLETGEIRRLGSDKNQHVDVRLIAATHRNLQQMVRDHLFREDLYYRLHVLDIVMPPLRERGRDIIELAETILANISKKFNRKPYAFSDGALSQLQQYHWPGNVRELQNVIERAILLSNNQTIGSNELGLPTMAETGQSVKAPALSLDDYLVDFVTKHQHHMSETQMAEHLGISRKSLWEKRQRLDIPRTPRK